MDKIILVALDGFIFNRVDYIRECFKYTVCFGVSSHIDSQMQETIQ